MEYKDKINDLIVLSRIAGLIEGLSVMQGAQISKAAAIRLEEASDRLGIMIGDMFNEAVKDDEVGIRICTAEELERSAIDLDQ